MVRLYRCTRGAARLLFVILGLVSSLMAVVIPSVAMEFSKEVTVDLSPCTIWSVPVFDEEGITVSCEGNGRLYMARYDLDLEPVTGAKIVASSSDFSSGEAISDHKHIFQNGFHYVVFSSRGSGSGGELVLLKLDGNLGRVGKVKVVQNDSPTNDMFLVGDGSNVYVGKYSPSNGGHKVYAYDADLNEIGAPVPIGGFDRKFGELHHANGAVSLWTGQEFVLVAPETLAPGDNDYFFMFRFDSSWSPLAERETIYEDSGDLGIVSGLSWDEATRRYLLTFSKRASGEREVKGPVYTVMYDSKWQRLSETMLLNGKYERPHTVLVGDSFYVGYDGENSGYKAYLTKFSVTRAPDELSDGQDGETGMADDQDHEASSGQDQPADLALASVELDISLGEIDAGDGQPHGGIPGEASSLGSVEPVISLQYDEGTQGPVVDWWIAVLAPDGFLVLDLNEWRWSFVGDDAANLTPVVQYNLLSFSDLKLPPFRFIKGGTYYFFFGVDSPDGTVNSDIVYTFREKRIEQADRQNN